MWLACSFGLYLSIYCAGSTGRGTARPVAHEDSALRPGEPKELHLKLRLPTQNQIKSVAINGGPASLGGLHNDTIIIQTRRENVFEVIGQFI